MEQLVYESVVDAPVEAVWKFYSNADALLTLTPPNRKTTLLSEDAEVCNGAIHKVGASQFGIPMEWHVEISDVIPNRQFVDSALKSPFKVWRHLHEFIPQGEQTILRDSISYLPPLGVLGKIANWLFIRRDLDAMFAFRHRVTQEHFKH